MFQGETAITIDDKGRLAIPTAYRDLIARECGNRLVLTYNPFDAGSLYLYPYAVWEGVRDKVNALPRTRSTTSNSELASPISERMSRSVSEAMRFTSG